MRLSKPILEVLRWACEQKLEACRLPIRALPGSPLARARALGLVVVEEPGIPPGPLLCATDRGREVYRERIVDHTPSPATRARLALREHLPARDSRQLVEAVKLAAASSPFWAEATADTLCALGAAMNLHGLRVKALHLHGVARPRSFKKRVDVKVYVHPVGIAIFLGENDDKPGVLMAQAFLDKLLRHPVAIYPWLLERHTPASLGRASLVPPTSWFYYVTRNGHDVLRLEHLGEPSGGRDEDVLRAELLAPGVGWV